MEEIGSVTTPPPKLPFYAPPHLLHLCAMDSMMPSSSRSLEMNVIGSPVSLPSAPQITEEPSLQFPEISSTQIGKVSSSRVKETVTTAKKTAVQSVNSIPLQGAWTSPLKLLTPSIPTLRYNTASLLSDLESQWPSLDAVGNQIRSRRPPQATHKSSVHQSDVVGRGSLASLDLDLGLNSPEYPWAAKMKPSVRNLHRVTTPSFMEDGTPKVCIPKQVLLEGVENQKEYIIGQFYRCAAPTGGQIHVVMSKIWGKRCRIFTRKLGESSYLFHIPDESTRQWILQRGLWHVDDCLMFVSAWNPVGTITIPEISTIPIWLTLRNIPNQLYSRKGISWIASGLGAPMLTSKPWLDPTQMGEAKILVEVKLDKPFSPKVAIEDESGSVTMVDVLYSWLPPKCANCGHLGHKATRCLGKLPSQKQDKIPISFDIASNNILPVNTSSTLPIGVAKIISTASAIITPSSVSIANAQDSVAADTDITPIFTDATNGVQDVSATASIDTCIDPTAISTEHASSAQVCSSSVGDVSASDKIEIFLPAAATTEAETKLTKTASQTDATSSLGELTPPATCIVISTPHGITLPLEENAATDVEVDLSECRTLDNEAMLGNGRNSQGSDLDLMENLQDEELASASNMRSLRERPVKPTQKMQEMEWTTVKGRGTRGRRGRAGNFG